VQQTPHEIKLFSFVLPKRYNKGQSSVCTYLHRTAHLVVPSIASNPAARANPAAAIAESTFSGAFLDIRSVLSYSHESTALTTTSGNSASAIYGCFLGVGAFIFGLVRAYSPKLLFMSIFGTIALDIFCVGHLSSSPEFIVSQHTQNSMQTIGPLIPEADYTLLKSLAISVSCYMAVAILLTICVFPQTMNHLCMDMISTQLGRLKALVEIQQEVLDAAPLDLAPGSTLIGAIMKKRTEVIGGQRQCEWHELISSEIDYSRRCSDVVFRTD
jgi:hypothetical protein